MVCVCASFLTFSPLSRLSKLSETYFTLKYTMTVCLGVKVEQTVLISHERSHSLIFVVPVYTLWVCTLGMLEVFVSSCVFMTVPGWEQDWFLSVALWMAAGRRLCSSTVNSTINSPWLITHFTNRPCRGSHCTAPITTVQMGQPVS